MKLSTKQSLIVFYYYYSCFFFIQKLVKPLFGKEDFQLIFVQQRS